MPYSANRIIAVNTIMLYARMVVVTVFYLFASRLVIRALGVDDYGLYTLLAGVVALLGYVNLSMASASQRFLSADLAGGDSDKLRRTFSALVVVHVLIAAGVLIAGEIGGCIYVEYFLNVRSSMRGDAMVVLQFALVALTLQLLSVPYQSVIFAREKMSLFAGVALIEGTLNLICGIVVTFVEGNCLVVYALARCVAQALVCGFYVVYSWSRFPETHLTRSWKREDVKAVACFSGWKGLGTFSQVVIDQGVNIVLNLFFGVVVNAARGIAFLVTGAVNSLAVNLQQAVVPQIIKSYINNERARNLELIGNGTRLGFGLMLLLALPVVMNLPQLLYLWLGELPEYASVFSALIIVASLFMVCGSSLETAVMATNRIRGLQLAIAIVNFSVIPLSVFAALITDNPYSPLWLVAAMSLAGFIIRLSMASRILDFPLGTFLRSSLLPCLLCVVAASLACYGVDFAFPNPSETVSVTLARLLLMLLVTAGVEFGLLLTREERSAILSKCVKIKELWALK